MPERTPTASVAAPFCDSLMVVVSIAPASGSVIVVEAKGVKLVTPGPFGSPALDCVGTCCALVSVTVGGVSAAVATTVVRASVTAPAASEAVRVKPVVTLWPTGTSWATGVNTSPRSAACTSAGEPRTV